MNGMVGGFGADVRFYAQQQTQHNAQPASYPIQSMNHEGRTSLVDGVSAVPPQNMRTVAILDSTYALQSTSSQTSEFLEVAQHLSDNIKYARGQLNEWSTSETVNVRRILDDIEYDVRNALAIIAPGKIAPGTEHSFMSEPHGPWAFREGPQFTTALNRLLSGNDVVYSCIQKLYRAPPPPSPAAAVQDVLAEPSANVETMSIKSSSPSESSLLTTTSTYDGAQLLHWRRRKLAHRSRHSTSSDNSLRPDALPSPNPQELPTDHLSASHSPTISRSPTSTSQSSMTNSQPQSSISEIGTSATSFSPKQTDSNQLSSIAELPGDSASISQHGQNLPDLKGLQISGVAAVPRPKSAGASSPAPVTAPELNIPGGHIADFFHPGIHHVKQEEPPQPQETKEESEAHSRRPSVTVTAPAGQSELFIPPSSPLSRPASDNGVAHRQSDYFSSRLQRHPSEATPQVYHPPAPKPDSPNSVKRKSLPYPNPGSPTQSPGLSSPQRAPSATSNPANTSSPTAPYPTSQFPPAASPTASPPKVSSPPSLVPGIQQQSADQRARSPSQTSPPQQQVLPYPVVAPNVFSPVFDPTKSPQLPQIPSSRLSIPPPPSPTTNPSYQSSSPGIQQPVTRSSYPGPLPTTAPHAHPPVSRQSYPNPNPNSVPLPKPTQYFTSPPPSHMSSPYSQGSPVATAVPAPLRPAPPQRPLSDTAPSVIPQPSGSPMYSRPHSQTSESRHQSFSSNPSIGSPFLAAAGAARQSPSNLPEPANFQPMTMTIASSLPEHVEPDRRSIVSSSSTSFSPHPSTAPPLPAPAAAAPAPKRRGGRAWLAHQAAKTSSTGPAPPAY